MKAVALILAAVLSLSSATPVSVRNSLTVDCNVYQAFIDFKCDDQQQHDDPDNPIIGGWCGRTPACLGGDTVDVPESEEAEFKQWQDQQPQPASKGQLEVGIKVKCDEYDSFVDDMCIEQRKNNPGLAGGYCGRPLTCWSCKELYVPERDVVAFTQWRASRP
jgi:hypothetical protein